MNESGWWASFVEKYTPVPDFLIGEKEEGQHSLTARLWADKDELKMKPAKHISPVGRVLNAIATVKRAGTDVIESLEQALRVRQIIRGYNYTAFQEHQLLTGSEKKGLLNPLKGSFGFVYPLEAREGVDIRALQNKHAAKTIREYFRGVGDTGREKDIQRGNLLPTMKTEVVLGMDMELVGTRLNPEQKGLPVRVRVLRGNPPRDFVDIIFKDFESKPENNSRLVPNLEGFLEWVGDVRPKSTFEEVDYIHIATGGTSEYQSRMVGDIKASRPRTLDEWYRVGKAETSLSEIDYDSPDVVVGLGNAAFRLDTWTSDINPSLLIELNDPDGQVASNSVIANKHFERNGTAFLGSMPTDKKPLIPKAIHEAVMQDPEIKEMMEQTPASMRRGIEYLRKMGEFKPRTIPLFSRLSNTFVAKKGDLRKAVENWNTINSFQSKAIAEFAEITAGVHRVQVNFELPILLQEELRTAHKDEIFGSNLKSVILPALAAYLTTYRNTGIDVRLLFPDGMGGMIDDLDMAPMGLDILEDVLKILREFENDQGCIKLELSSLAEEEFSNFYTEDRNAIEFRKSLSKMSTYIEEIVSGLKRGSVGTNVSLGILQKLESLSVEGGASIVSGVLRLQQHYSRAVSQQAKNMYVLFRSALGADGTGVNFAETSNGSMSYEATLDDHLIIADNLIPIMRGNVELKESFLDFVDKWDGWGSGRDAKKRKIALHQILEDESYVCFTDTTNYRNSLHKRGVLWGDEQVARRLAGAADAKIRKDENAKLDDVVAIFNDFVKAKRLEQKPADIENDKVSEGLQILSNGGFAKIWETMTKYTVAKYKFELAKSSIVFRLCAKNKQVDRIKLLMQAQDQYLDEMKSFQQELSTLMCSYGGEHGFS